MLLISHNIRVSCSQIYKALKQRNGTILVVFDGVDTSVEPSRLAPLTLLMKDLLFWTANIKVCVFVRGAFSDVVPCVGIYGA